MVAFFTMVQEIGLVGRKSGSMSLSFLRQKIKLCISFLGFCKLDRPNVQPLGLLSECRQHRQPCRRGKETLRH
jgi:hypothetical protein